MLSELQNSKRIVGLKQVKKAIDNKTVKKVFLSQDVTPDIYDKVIDLCKANSIDVELADSMKQLGIACKIDVPAAVAAITI